MSYNGSGTFVINTAGQPVVSGTVISSTAFNALTADLATGLSTAITKDGQTTPTANIPMGNNKITGLAVGTAATDAANLSQVQSTAAKLVGSVSGVDTITGTMSPTLAAYAAGQMFYFVAAGDNTGAVTLNLDGLGAKAVTRDGSVALAAGDIKSGEVVVVVYDGTRFQVVSQLNSAGNATFANVSITSALNVGGVATFTGNPVLSGGTANGVLYLNGSKVATSGSALVFDGTNLGIGTSSPGQKLEVNGAALVNGSTGFLRVAVSGSPSSGAAALQVSVNSTNARTIRMENTLAGGRTYDIINGAAGVAGNLGIFDDTAGAYRLTLDSSGNLGLGVTPSAWSQGNAFEIDAAGNSIFGNGANDIWFTANANFNSTWKYVTSTTAAAYRINGGAHEWRTAASGTAGNAITFTQAMTLDASGNLGVGTTSPTSGFRLDLQATTALQRIESTTGTNTVQQRFVNTGGTLFVGLDNSAGSSFASAYAGVLWHGGNYPLIFATNNTERARILSSGTFCINTQGLTNNGRLSVATSNSTPAGRFYSAATDGDICVIIDKETNTTTTAQWFLGFTVNAQANASGVVTANGAQQAAFGTWSDRRLKQNISDLPSQWNSIKSLRPVEFDYIESEGGGHQISFIAQEFEEVYPDSVGARPDGMKTLTGWGKTEARLVKALQEAMARIEKLEAEMAALKGA